MISLRTNAKTVAGYADVDNLPPLPFSRRLRMTFMLSMGIPDSSKRRFTSIRSRNVSPFLGEQKRADPPPLMHANIKVLESDIDVNSSISDAACTDRSSGMGWDADRTIMLYFSCSVLISSSVA